MKIEGLAGCFEKTGGLFYFARMCSKIRLHTRGALPEEYWKCWAKDSMAAPAAISGSLTRTCASAFSREPRTTRRWRGATKRRRALTDEEILIYNSFMSKRGWHDDESDEFIPAMIREYGLPDDGTVLTDFDLIEMDEGRWYPDMWRDAWRSA